MDVIEITSNNATVKLDWMEIEDLFNALSLYENSISAIYTSVEVAVRDDDTAEDIGNLGVSVDRLASDFFMLLGKVIEKSEIEEKEQK